MTSTGRGWRLRRISRPAGLARFCLAAGLATGALVIVAAPATADPCIVGVVCISPPLPVPTLPLPTLPVPTLPPVITSSTPAPPAASPPSPIVTLPTLPIPIPSLPLPPGLIGSGPTPAPLPIIGGTPPATVPPLPGGVGGVPPGSGGPGTGPAGLTSSGGPGGGISPGSPASFGALLPNRQSSPATSASEPGGGALALAPPPAVVQLGTASGISFGHAPFLWPLLLVLDIVGLFALAILVRRTWSRASG